MRKDWTEIQLGEFLDFKGGGTPRKNRPEYWHGDIPWASIKDIKGRYLTATGDKITKLGLNNSSANIAESNQIILATRIIPGRPIITKIKTSINQDLKIVNPKIHIDRDFLYFLLAKLERKILKVSSGTTVLGITLNNLKEIPAPIPPPPEQRAIVAKIEQLFSELDNGIANLKTAQEQLKVYREALLLHGTSGIYSNQPYECVNPINIGNPSNKQNKPKSWKWIPLPEVATLESGHTPRKTIPDYWENGDVPWICLQDIRAADGTTILKTKYQPTIKGIENSSARLLPKGTVVFSRDISVGFVTIMGESMATTQHFANWICSEEINNTYLMYAFMASKKSLINRGQGTTVKTLYMTELKQLHILLPPVEEQHQIVQEIESRLSVCNKVEETIKESLEKAEALRQSILKKAFEGQLLTQQELEACKKEADWETAEQLLQRIKGDKDKTEIPKIAAKTKLKTAGKSISTTDMHAGILTKVIQLHEKNPKYLDKLSHVKCEKIAHLAEYYVGLDLGRMPRKDAAGPDDYPHLKKVESRAQKAGFFTKVPQDIGYSYKTNRQADAIVQKADTFLTEVQTKKLNYLLQTFLKFDLEQAEIVATTYAGWNNLLLDGIKPTEEQIVYESRENWSKRKLGIPRERFFRAIKWMQDHDFAPKGTGLKVEKPSANKRNRKT